MGHDIIPMSNREIDRYHVIRQLLDKKITTKNAATQLNLSVRHVKRLKKRVRVSGKRGLIHQSRGKPSHHRVSASTSTKIIKLITRHYPDFGPTFAAEKLRECHGIDHDPKTVQSIMVTSGLWTTKCQPKKSPHRAWRARKDCFGEMEQFDGSYHDWFEGRAGPDTHCLLASIDDATGTITKAEFAEHEGVFPVFGFWRDYLLTHGKPRSIYLDKFSTYRMNQQVAKENHETLTQFQRAMNELGIEPITAHSPEAKGRVERLFETLQDRLVKEFRLQKINTVEAANQFLAEIYIPDFNKRFGVTPASTTNAHRPLTAQEQANLPAIFSRQCTRVVRNDFTLSYRTTWYQLGKQQPVTVCKKDVLTVEERLDGSIKFRLRGKYLNATALPERPKRATTKTLPWVIAKTKINRVPWRPAPNHPWRKRLHALPKSKPTTTLIPVQG